MISLGKTCVLAMIGWVHHPVLAGGVLLLADYPPSSPVLTVSPRALTLFTMCITQMQDVMHASSS